MSGSVDRARTCPFLLRVFVRNGSHNELAAYGSHDFSALAKSEHSVYAWKDMTLREVVNLLRSVAPGLRNPGNAKFGIRHVFAAAPSRSRDDRPQGWNYRDLGFVFARDLNGKGDESRTGKNDPSLRTLEQHRFIPGDFLDVAYLTQSSTHPSNTSANTGQASGRTIPSLQGNNKPSFSNTNGRFGMSEADQAWGVAGDQHRRPSTGMRSGGNRVNPLLSGRGVGFSIMGAGRRQSQSGEADVNGGSKRSRDEGGNDDMQIEE